MGLYEEIEKLDAEIDGVQEEPAEQEEESHEVDTDAPAEEDSPTENEANPKEEDVSSQQAQPEHVAKPDNVEMARQRVKEKERADAAIRRAAELEAELAVLKAPKVQEVADPEPNPQDKVAHLEWQVRQIRKQNESALAFTQELQQERAFDKTISAAKADFIVLEQEFLAQGTPDDYMDVMEHAFRTIAMQVKAANPNIVSEDQLRKATETRLLQMAGMELQMGYNPAQALYARTKGLMGYAPKEAPAPVAAKPTLSVISSNKKSPSSPLTAGGRSGKAGLSLAAIEKMTNEQLAQLSDEEFAQVVGV